MTLPELLVTGKDYCQTLEILVNKIEFIIIINMLFVCIYETLSYCGKVWRGESLAKSLNQFVKVN